MATRKSRNNKAKKIWDVVVLPDNFLTTLVRDLISKNDHILNEIGINIKFIKYMHYHAGAWERESNTIPMTPQDAEFQLGVSWVYILSA